MVSQVTQNLFATVYKDDYRDSDNYHRILFNSRRALQARELTQMQSIIQNEVSRFGRNIFKDGAAVNPGGPTIDATYEFIKLNTGTYALPATPSTLVGTFFTGASSNLKMQVLQVVPAEGSDPATLYVQYLGDATSGAATAVRATPNETMTNGVTTLQIQSTNTTLNPAVGRGVKFSSGAGDFFTQGHFVYNTAQSVILSKYSPLYTGIVGFRVTEDVVTATDNSALYDNQGAVPNVTAPGADRYRIRLELIDQSLVDSADSFVYFANIVDSVIVQNATGTDDYNKINDLLALRTKEESGDYIVRPFTLKFDEDSAGADYLLADVSAGTAYINGYRVNLPVPTSIRTDIPNSTQLVNNEVVAAGFGSYVIASTIVGVPNVNELERWVLFDSSARAIGDSIGTARIGLVEEDGAVYNMHLFDIKMNTNKSFRSVKSIGAVGSLVNNATLVLENNEAVLKGTSASNLLFPLPQSRPQTLADISLQVQKRFTATADGAGSATLGSGLLGAGEAWSNTNDWVIVNNTTGANLSASATVTGAGTTTATITGVGAGTVLEILAFVNQSAATARAKTLTESTLNGLLESDGSGLKFINLRKADIYSVDRVRSVDSNGADLSGLFTVDDGQRDTYYNIGRLILQYGRTVPVGGVFVRYKHFEHGTGSFFSVNSYAVDYSNIPSYKLSDGTTIQLRDVLDFRSRIDSSGTSFSGATARVNFLPVPSDLIQFDATYYLPRNDKLVLSQTGELSIIEGKPSFDPQYPITPENTLELYKIRMGANTLNDSDIATSVVEHKRYTMADIGRLEKRIDRLEEYTTLSMLELSTDTVSVFDSAGLSRTKAGFLADNFADHYYSDTSAIDYRASIDLGTKTLRPSVYSNNIRMIYDSSVSSNVVIKGDNVYLRYTETPSVTQDFISESENINPFSVVNSVGIINLSPASDEWMVTEYTTPRVIDGGTRIENRQERLFNFNQISWQGRTGNRGLQDNLDLAMRGSWLALIGGAAIGRPTTTTTTSSSTVSRVVSDETIREVIGDRVVDIALIPFMRSRRIYFRARGLKPFQTFYPFFDGVNVSSWVKQEAFVQFGASASDYGNRYIAATSHPWGSSTLVSDANGEIQGSFFIPSPAPGSTVPRFRTGTRELKFINVTSNDNSAATSWGTATYTARGVLETRQQTIRSTREIVNVITTTVTTTTTTVLTPTRNIDPLAQSFLVAEPEGVFLTKVRVYFKSKPGVGANPAPAILEIRPVVNGVPSSTEVVPGSIVSKLPSEVTLPASETKANILAAGTDFVFDEPIYLMGDTEYAVVLLADTTDYRVYVAKAGAFEIGTTERRIGTQPSLGSLFLSQTGTTWTPDQTRDLTFRLYKAQFSTAGGFATIENANVPLTGLGFNPLTINNASRWVTVAHPDHGFDSGDTVKIYGLDSATTYGGVLGSSIMGANTVSFPDGTGYQIYIDSAPTGSVFAGSGNVIATHNLIYSILNPHLDTLVPDGTGISFEGKFTSGRSLAGGETRFVRDTNFNSVVVKEDNYSLVPLMIANEEAQVSQMGGLKSATMKVSMTTTSANVSPVLDLQRCSLILVNNKIDKQSTDRNLTRPTARAGSGLNTPLVFVAETSANDGSHAAKHVTVPVTLAETAVGLRIILAANRPSVSDFLVYYRTATGGQNLLDQSWVLIAPESSIPSDENPSVFREYRYLAGGLGGSLIPFTDYQLKIVFRSSSDAKVPSIKDLRVIAMAD